MNNPFDRYKKGFTLDTKSPIDYAYCGIGASPQSQAQKNQEAEVGVGNMVVLPKHLYTPEGAKSVDIRNLVSITPGSSFDVLVFEAPEGTTVMFTHYAIFSDALDFNSIEFVPTVNYQRIYPFHGEPSNGYKIALGLGPDLSNNSLIEGPLQINPGQTLRWTIVNNDVVDVVLGVRMKGYADSTGLRVSRAFGG